METCLQVKLVNGQQCTIMIIFKVQTTNTGADITGDSNISGDVIASGDVTA